MIDFDLVQEQWRQEDEFERMSLEFIEPLLKAWVVLRNSSNVTGDLIADYMNTTTEALKYCWGEEALAELHDWELV